MNETCDNYITHDGCCCVHDNVDCTDGICGKPATHFIPEGNYERQKGNCFYARGLTEDGQWLCDECYDEWVGMFGENWKQFKTDRGDLTDFFKRALKHAREIDKQLEKGK